jgi:cyclopropane fatty-acyl-phospholipid synthase-like methyltransferase
VQQLYPGIGKQGLEFTDPLAEGFHKVTHGKGGTVAGAYNDTIRQWLSRFGTTKTEKEFLEFVRQQREEYLRLYEQYLTGG